MESKKVTLLLVEDEALIALAETRALVSAGYSIVHAHSGEEAIAEINGNLGSEINLILMDVDLGPGIDGVETAKEISKHHDIPIVFLSSHTKEYLAKKTEDIISFGNITKGVELPILSASVSRAFRQYQAFQELEAKEGRFHSQSEN